MTPAKQRALYGFWTWVAEEDAASLPDAFVETVVQMQGGTGELPTYYQQPTMQYILTGVAATDAAAARLVSESDPLMPWVYGPPMVAVDGRLLQYIVSTWTESIEANLDTVMAMAPAQASLSTAIGAAGRAGLNVLGELLRETDRVVKVAHTFGVPVWSMLSEEISEGQGGFFPTYVMTPSTLLEDWAALYLDSKRMIEDAQLSVATGSAEGTIHDYAQMYPYTTTKRQVTVPMIVGFTALGMSTVGMVLAVTSGWMTARREKR